MNRACVLVVAAAVAAFSGDESTASAADAVSASQDAAGEDGDCPAGGAMRSKLYWTLNFPNKIQRSDWDGSNIEDVVEGLAHPQGLAVDEVGGKLYWSDSKELADVLQRSNLDGSDVEDIFSDASSWGLAVDAKAEKLYWSDVNRGSIRRSNLDGSEVEDVVPGGLDEPAGIALDGEGRIYWCDMSAKIQRARLDGSEVEDVVTGLAFPQGLSIDQSGRKLYWTDSGSFKLQRAALDGSSIEDVMTGLKDPRGVFVGPGHDLYWTTTGIHYAKRKGPSVDSSSGSISRVSANASSVDQVITTSRARPISVLAVALPGPACGEKVGSRRLRVGDLVELASEPASESGDAARGPLRAGDIGRIAADDRSDMPFMVSVEGQEWWYRESSLRLVAPR